MKKIFLLISVFICFMGFNLNVSAAENNLITYKATYTVDYEHWVEGQGYTIVYDLECVTDKKVLLSYSAISKYYEVKPDIVSLHLLDSDKKNPKWKVVNVSYYRKTSDYPGDDFRPQDTKELDFISFQNPEFPKIIPYGFRYRLSTDVPIFNINVPISDKYPYGWSYEEIDNYFLNDDDSGSVNFRPDMNEDNSELIRDWSLKNVIYKNTDYGVSAPYKFKLSWDGTTKDDIIKDNKYILMDVMYTTKKFGANAESNKKRHVVIPYGKWATTYNYYDSTMESILDTLYEVEKMTELQDVIRVKEILLKPSYYDSTLKKYKYGKTSTITLAFDYLSGSTSEGTDIVGTMPDMTPSNSKYSEELGVPTNIKLNRGFGNINNTSACHHYFYWMAHGDYEPYYLYVELDYNFTWKTVRESHTYNYKKYTYKDKITDDKEFMSVRENQLFDEFFDMIQKPKDYSGININAIRLRYVLYQPETKTFLYGPYKKFDNASYGNIFEQWNPSIVGEDENGDEIIIDKGPPLDNMGNPINPSIPLPGGGGDINLEDSASLFKWLTSFLKDMIVGIGSFPSLIGALFVFMPNQWISLITFGLGLSIVLRVIGR